MNKQSQLSSDNSSQAKSKLKEKGIILFILLSFGLACLTISTIVLLGISSTSELGQALYFLYAFTPAIAAIIVRSRITKEGFKDSGLRPNLKTKWPYYIFSAFWPFLIIGGTSGILIVASIFNSKYGLPLGNIGSLTDVIGWFSIMTGMLIYLPFMWGEEFGWRGYLQTRLFGEKPLLAALTTGLIWGVWHFPAILVGFIPNQNGVLSLLLFPWYTIWFSIILGWLIRRTNSIWTATLAHSANNFILNSAQVGLLLSFSGGLGDLLLSIPAIIIVIPITLLCSWTVTRLRM